MRKKMSVEAMVYTVLGSVMFLSVVAATMNAPKNIPLSVNEEVVTDVMIEVDTISRLEVSGLKALIAEKDTLFFIGAGRTVTILAIKGDSALVLIGSRYHSGGLMTVVPLRILKRPIRPALMS